jgi:putative ABC transport system permease protein
MWGTDVNIKYFELSYAHVSLAALLIIVNGVISIALRLRMEWSLLLASVRTVVQLLLIGFVLKWVFQVDRWYVVIALGLVMTLIAGYTAISRSRRRFPGMWIDAVVSVWASSWIVTAFALLAVFRGIPHWWQPQYAIPLLGMVLGNSLNGISVGVTTLTESLTTRRSEVETLLSLGATRWEAARGPIQHAVRTGMIPIINSMMVVGIVSLPGMMTGQLLSGADPIEAVKYQIVIMFLIASATAMGTVGVVLLSYRRLFNANHQFRFDLITSSQSRLVAAVKKIGHDTDTQEAKHKEKR